MTQTYFAPAKINLWLRVFAPDHSGYHPLDTLFCAIDLCDRLEIGNARGLELEVSGADVGPAENNLVFRAAQEYYRLLGVEPQVKIHLQKRIPAGAGLGGGSSDAAAALRALQARYDDALPTTELMALAARIGSDVPFFLCGAALAQASGRGEVLQVLPPLPIRHVLIVQPDFGIATRDAYGWLDAEGACGPAQRSLAAPQDWQAVARNATNSFEAVLFRRYPVLAHACHELRAQGATITLVSGSGSALFGIFDDAASAEKASRSMSLAPGWQIHAARTLDSRND